MVTSLLKNTQHFGIDISYELLETGSSKQKPLFVYFHGYKQNLSIFRKNVSSLLDIKGYHLFVQGPYIIYDEKRKRDVSQWGRAWYLYDGDQEQFKQSLEKSACYVQEILAKVYNCINERKTVLIGYSMGGYQAGYYALSRSCSVDELVVVGGRIKTELFAGNTYSDLNVLALHGENDSAVNIQAVEESADNLRTMGADVSFCRLDEGHRLSQVYIAQIKKWLIECG